MKRFLSRLVESFKKSKPGRPLAELRRVRLEVENLERRELMSASPFGPAPNKPQLTQTVVDGKKYLSYDQVGYSDESGNHFALHYSLQVCVSGDYRKAENYKEFLPAGPYSWDYPNLVSAPPGLRWYYRVGAFTCYHGGNYIYSDPFAISAPPPVAPHLAIQRVSPTQLSLHYNSVSGVEGYSIQKRTMSGWVSVGSDPVQDVQDNAQYRVGVRYAGGKVVWGTPTTPATFASLANGELHIDGTNAADVITIQDSGGSIQVLSSGGAVPIYVNSNFKAGKASVAATQVTKIVVHGWNGEDTIRNDTTLPSEIFGGTNDDTLIGGSAKDTLRGQGDKDKLDGRKGVDKLFGGANNDILEGGEDEDFLNGGEGDDTYYFDDHVATGNNLDLDHIDDAAMTGDHDTLDFSKFSIGVGISLQSGNINEIRDSLGNYHLRLELQVGSRIEDAIGSEWADTIYGNEWDNHLQGRGGNDDLKGFTPIDAQGHGPTTDDGKDKLEGGLDRDDMRGGTGFDTYTDDFDPNAPFYTQKPLQPGRPTTAIDRDDIVQQSNGSCAVLASLAALAESGFNFADSQRYQCIYDGAMKMYHYRIFLYTNGQLKPQDVYFGKLPDPKDQARYNGRVIGEWNDNIASPTEEATAATGNRYAFVPEFWTMLYQRAYLQQQGIDPMDPSQEDWHQWEVVHGKTWESANIALASLTNKPIAMNGLTWQQHDLSNALNGLAALVAGTKEDSVADPRLTAEHAYTVVAMYQDSAKNWFVDVRDPVGFNAPNFGYVNGVRWEDFKASCSYLDVVQ